MPRPDLRRAAALLALAGILLSPLAAAAFTFVAYTSPTIVYVGTYASGSGNAQSWSFRELITLDECIGLGSIEVGFTGPCASGVKLAIAGTGHFHSEPTTWDFHTGITVCRGACDVATEFAV